jgi:hypothetical protein
MATVWRSYESVLNEMKPVNAILKKKCGRYCEENRRKLIISRNNKGESGEEKKYRRI